jgi:type I restriction enzyme S subunit
MIEWLRKPLAAVAPPRTSVRRFFPDEPVWHLTLDQIESHTGRVTNKRIAPAAEAGGSTFVFDTGTVLYSKLRPYLNKVVLPDDVGIATTELVPLRPDPAVLLPEFLAYYLRSDQFVAFASQAVAGVKMPRIIMAKFWEHRIPIPPLAEQRRIVEILDQADAIRKLRIQADAKTERIVPALFIKMFGDPATNPNGWVEKPLGALSLDLRYGTSQRCDSAPDGTPVLRIPNVIRGEIDWNDLKYAHFTEREKQRLRLRQGDLLFVRTNGNPEYVGRCAVFDSSQRSDTLFASYLIRARLDKEQIDPWFLAAFLSTPAGRRAMKPYIRTTAGQSNISTAGIREVSVTLPPFEMQVRFREHWFALRDHRARGAVIRERVDRLFSVLLHHAFTGDLTARWREAHMNELLQEMEHQSQLVGEAL